MKWILLFLSLLAFEANASKLSGYSGILLTNVSVTIANGQQESSLVSLNGFSLVGIQTPATLTSTAVTFESCNADGSTCIPLKTTTSGTALSYTIAVSGFYAIDPVPFYGVQYLKLKSGSAEGGARVLLISLKGI